jgi:hypothetical protein
LSILPSLRSTCAGSIGVVADYPRPIIGPECGGRDNTSSVEARSAWRAARQPHHVSLANGIAATKVSRAYQSGHDIVLPIAGLYWQDNSVRASMASFARPGLYRLALHFKNLKRTARRFVIEHGDHQPPGIPSEGVKVRSVLY